MTSSPASSDDYIASVLDRLAEEFRERGKVDLSRISQEHPEVADEVLELWNTVLLTEAMAADVGSTSVAGNAGPPPDFHQLPTTFGDYEILEEIGRGGMGVVFKARQRSLQRVVALKLILGAPWATEAGVARFHAEARAVAQLDHPQIVPVYEVGEIGGQPYFTMRYIEGETLAQRLARGPVTATEAVTWMEKICSAVRHAHEQGILHRDLKPSNIMLDQQGEPHITDFGLAKWEEDSSNLTQTAAILGTPSYVSPEQAAGKREEIGPTSDVYSLGAILYQMLTGRPPFQAATALETVMLVLEQDPLPPRLLNRQMDPRLESIVLCCLQKTTRLRYASAEKMRRDLTAFLNDEPLESASGLLQQRWTVWLRDTHHAPIMENWGLLWIWHSIALLVLCFVTNVFQWQGLNSPWPYLALWGGGLAVWARIFWALRRRTGPVSFVERQIAHLWGASVIASVMLFVVDYLLGLDVLTLSPVLPLIAGTVFIAKAGTLTGQFYIYGALMFLISPLMAWLQSQEIQIGLTLFGLVAATAFFVPGWKYYRQRSKRLAPSTKT